MMPSIKALIRNERSAQNAMHNGMTPQDAGHVILNLFNLWEPCAELTFESSESQAKQDHGAPHRARDRRACTCRSVFFTLLLDGSACFRVSSPQSCPEVADLDLGGELRISPVPLSLCCQNLQSCVLRAPKAETMCSTHTTGHQGLYLINHFNPTAFFNADHQGTEEFGFLWMLLHLRKPKVLQHGLIHILARVVTEKLNRIICRNAAVDSDSLLT